MVDADDKPHILIITHLNMFPCKRKTLYYADGDDYM
jgi:hypothetical protein